MVVALASGGMVECGMVRRALLCVLLGCETVTVRPPTEPEPEVDDEVVDEAPSASSLRAVALGVGPRASCAALDDGSLRCWGTATDGLLASEEGPGPVIVATGLADVQVVSVGLVRACVVADGVLRCHGRTGAGADTVVRELTEVRGIASGRDVALAEEHGCAIDADAQVWCFGSSNMGRTGSRRDSWRVSAQVAVSGAQSIAVGRLQSCVSTAGPVQCWGLAAGGRLGTSSVRYYTETPVPVEGVEAARQLASHPLGSQTCALLADDEIACWGIVGPALSRTSLGATPVRLTPVGEPILRVAVGPLEVLAIAESGALYRYVADTDAEAQTARYGEPSRLPAMPSVVDAGIGLAHTCVLTSDGQVMCWGLGAGGRLGNRSNEAHEHPVAVRWETM